MAIIWVPDDYTTIQAAVTAASTGDTILVRDGIYHEQVQVQAGKDYIRIIAAGDKVVKAEFSDKSKIPDWAAGYIDRLLEKKLMQGYSDDTLRPDKVLTRAEAAKIFDTYVNIKDSGL